MVNSEVTLPALARTYLCQRLKLKYDEALSNVGFNFNLRRYTKETFDPKGCSSDDYYDVLASAQRREAGAYTRPLLSSTSVVAVTQNTLYTTPASTLDIPLIRPKHPLSIP